MEFKFTKPRAIFSVLVFLFILTTYIHSSSGYSHAALKEIQRKHKHCCKFHPGSPSFNTSKCLDLKDLFEEELNRVVFTHSKSFKYAKQLWRNMSIVTKQHEELNDTSVLQWTVNASKSESVVNRTIVFKMTQTSPIQVDGNATKDTPGNILTRLELLVPFYYVGPPNICQKKFNGQRDTYISYNGKNISSEKGVPYNNILIFRLPHELTNDDNSSSINITVNANNHFMVTHLKSSMLLKYYNMNKDVIKQIRSVTIRQVKKVKVNKQREKRRFSTVTKNKSSKQKRSVKNVKMPSASSTGSPFCMVHKYVVGVKEHLNLRNIYMPATIDIGRCSGQCNSINIRETNRYMTGRSILLNIMLNPPRGEDVKLQSSCVPDVMQSTTLLSFHQRSSIVAIYNVHSAMIASCRCA